MKSIVHDGDINYQRVETRREDAVRCFELPLAPQERSGRRIINQPSWKMSELQRRLTETDDLVDNKSAGVITMRPLRSYHCWLKVVLLCQNSCSSCRVTRHCLLHQHQHQRLTRRIRASLVSSSLHLPWVYIIYIYFFFCKQPRQVYHYPACTYRVSQKSLLLT